MAKPATAVRLTAVVVGATYAGALYLSGIHLQASWKQGLSYVPTAAVLLVTLWDVWLWRQPGVRKLARRPLLAGTWRATLQPTSDSHIPAGGNRGPIEAYVIINQSYWSIAVRQYTLESRSNSKGFLWATEAEGGTKTLTYTYLNTPKQQYEGRSQAHLGTAALNVVGDQPQSLDGYYFTDRYTKGDMSLSLFDRSVNHANFQAVSLHCQGT